MAVELSVVIPMHNGEATISHALASLGAQVAAPAFEVIVADNRSTDASASVVRDFARTASFPVHIVDANGRAGAAHARNVGALQAQGRRLLFCDCDDTYDPGFLRAMSDALDAADIVAAYHERPDEYASSLAAAPIARRGPAHTPTFSLLGYLPAGGGGGLGVQRERWSEVGGFDNSYRRGAEDNDFYWRVQEAGGVFTTAPRAVVVYSHRPTLAMTFRQYSNYRRGAVLLQSRFTDRVTEPVTFGGSLRHLAHTVISAPNLVGSAPGRRSLAAQLGGSLGSLLGLMRYQVLRRVPARQLMEP